MHFNFFGIVPPGPPSDLNISDVDSDSVTLSWAKPRKTGNGKISGYIVEYKSASGDDWVKATTLSGKESNATGKFYQIRLLKKNRSWIWYDRIFVPICSEWTEERRKILIQSCSKERSWTRRTRGNF